MSENNVYLLWHTHIDELLPGGEDVKLLGVYSSQEMAEAAQTAAGELEGFKDHLTEFEISEYSLDKREWREGFATIRHGSPTNNYWIGKVGHWISIAGKVKSRYNYEYRTLMVLADNIEAATQAIKKEARAYGQVYQNVYEQDVQYAFDKIYYVRQSHFFNNDDLDNGKTIELDSEIKTKKIVII